MTGKPPLVYVETNWVVAHVIAHDDANRAAHALLEQARRGECELRISHIAALESRVAVANVTQRFYKPFVETQKAITKAFRNGVPDLNVVAVAFNEPVVRAYMNRDTEELRKRLLVDPAVKMFSDPQEELGLRDMLHGELLLAGCNAVDFYILTSILADRAKDTDPGRPVILFSTNKEEFQAGKGFDADFYVKRRMVWRPDFQLVAALKDWAKEFS